VFNAKIADKLQAARERLAAATASGVEAVQLDAAQGEADGAPALEAAGEGAAAAPTASEEEQARLEAAKQARLKTAREKKAVAAAGKAKREQVEAALKAAEEEAARKVAEQAATKRKKTRQRQAAALEEAKERRAGALKAVEEEAAALKASNKLKQAAALKEAKQKQAATLQAAYGTAQVAAALQIHPAVARTCVHPSTESPTSLSDSASASSTEPLYSDNDSNSNSTVAAASDDDSSGGSNATEPLVSLVPGGAMPTAEVPAEVPGVAPTGRIWSHMFKVRDSWDAPRFWRACRILQRLPDGVHELLFPNGQHVTASAAAASINLLPYDMRIVDCLVVPEVVPAAVAAALPAIVPVVVPAAAPPALPAVVPPVMTPAVPARRDPRTHEITTEGAQNKGTPPPSNNKATPSPTTILEPAHKRARHNNTDEEQHQQPKQASLAADTNLHPWSQLQKHLLRQPVPTEPEEPNRASAICSDSYSSGRNGSSQADSSALGSVEPSAQQSAEPAPPAAAAWPMCISCHQLLQSVPFRTCIWCNSYVHTGSGDDDEWQCYLQLADGKFSCERCAVGHSTGL
jgi:hypothetical protein